MPTKASEYAEIVSKCNAPTFNSEGSGKEICSVSNDGGLIFHTSRYEKLSAKDALLLRDWLTATFE